MRKFYVKRTEDVSGNSGTGVVAEGIIFDDGTGAFTWLTPLKTVTMFLKIADVKTLHSHNGRTEVIIEGSKRFEACQAEARALKAKNRLEKRMKQNEKKE